MSNDWINGLFEVISGILLFRNCWLLHKDKCVKGVSITTTAFFMCWGYWNMYYYPSLNQVVSFYGGILVALVLTVWVVMAVYYKYRKEG